MEDKTITQVTNFDVLTTLLVIEQDADLTSMFKEEIKLDFNTLRSVASQNLLTPDTVDFLNQIFEKIILCKKEYLAKYVKLAPIEVKQTAVITPKPISVKVVKEKKETLPKWYGKEKILADVKKQGGKPSTLQNAMLSLNSMKNMFATLSARGIKDMLGGGNSLSDEDCRTIMATVSTMERKLEDILKKKK